MIAKGNFKLEKHQRATVRFRLTKAGARLIRGRRRLASILIVHAHGHNLATRTPIALNVK